MDGYLSEEVQRMQDSAAEHGAAHLATLNVDYVEGNQTFQNAVHVYDNGSRYGLNDLTSPSVAYDQGNNAAQNAGYGFNSANTNNNRRGLYGFNNFANPSPAYGVSNNAAQSAGYGAFPTSADDSLYPLGTITTLGYGGGSHAIQNAVNGGLSSLGDLAAPIGDYSQGNYASEDHTYSGLYPVNAIGATGASYDQGNSNGLVAYAGNSDNSLHRVDNISAPNAIYNQGDNAGLSPYAGNADEGFHPVDNMATPSTIRHGSGNARYGPSVANIHESLFPFTGLSAPNTGYDGANSGHQNVGFSPHTLGLTPAVDSTLPSSAAPGSRMVPSGRPRPTSVDDHGRPRWACTTCVKTFSRQADMERHAKKHSGVLQYQCNVTGCPYPGSYRQDKLEQHKRKCH